MLLSYCKFDVKLKLSLNNNLAILGKLLIITENLL